MDNNPLWALAPQYAESVFASLRKDAGIARALDPESADLAQMISRREGSTAIVSIRGPLDQATLAFNGNILALGYDAIRAAIHAALADPLVGSILLSIDSPGGIVAGAKELADYISRASAKKPMAAYADGLCASAAFWLAAATGRIYAPATALVGSIGVIMLVEDWSAWYAKMGIKLEYVASGKFKAAGADGKELSEEERAYFEGQLAEIHSIFKNDVRAALKLDAAEHLWAEAQLMPATTAQDVGLVSRIVRDRDEAAQFLAAQAALEESMEYTLAALQKEAPELLASIRKEAYEKGRSDASADNSLALAVVRLSCSPDQAQACEKMLAEAGCLGLTAAQVESFGAFFPKQAESQSRLEAIISAHAQPVNAEPEPQAKSRLLADAERRAAANNGGK